MSNDHEPVKPAPFSAAPAPSAPATNEAASDQAPGRWIVPLFFFLVAVALAVFFWLPGKVPEATVDITPGRAGSSEPLTRAPAPAAQTPPLPTVETTPYADGLTARERDEAQAVLEQVLDVQFALEEQGVEHWSAEAYTRAQRLAGEGDEAYRRRDFVAALGSYQSALDELTAIRERVPEVFATVTEMTRGALEASAVDLAQEQVEIAGLIAPDSEEVAALRERVAAAPAVADLRARSAAAAEAGELEAAIAALDQALELDAGHNAVAVARERLREALLERNFNAAMSAGYTALDAYHFAAARESFGRAAALKPDAPETKSALDEVKTEETAHTLRQLAGKGSAAEAEERWQEAVQYYEKALALDATVLFANQGLERARPRARLAEQLRLILREPERLEDIKVADATAKLLDDARSFGPPDTVLRRQVSELAQLLRKANTPVTVTLRSDAQTEVVVHKVARLGRFESHSLSLRPGTYTAVGSRRGYRDVRRSFTVAPGSGATAITIRCTEPI